MKKHRADWIDSPLASNEQVGNILGKLIYADDKRDFVAFLNRFKEDEKFSSYILFHLGEPLFSHRSLTKCSEDPVKEDVVVFHLNRFPSLPTLLQRAKDNRDKDNDIPFECWQEIDQTLYSLFGIDTEEITCSCTHDCCAHWFTRGFRIKIRGNVVRLKREWHMNI